MQTTIVGAKGEAGVEGSVVERVLSCDERRKQWLKEAFEGHAQSSVEKVWAAIDDEAFVDG